MQIPDADANMHTRKGALVLIRIVESRGKPPEIEDGGSVLWVGGQNQGLEEGSVSASVLVDITEALEVGTWYSFNDFKNLIASAQFSEVAGWTTIGIPQEDPEGRFDSSIEFDQEHAAILIARAAVEFGDATRRALDLWVRVE